MLSKYVDKGIDEHQALLDPEIRAFVAQSGLHARLTHRLKALDADGKTAVYAVLFAADKGDRQLDHLLQNSPYLDFALGQAKRLRDKCAIDRSQHLPPECPLSSKSRTWMLTSGLRPNTVGTIAWTPQLAHHGLTALMIEESRRYVDPEKHAEGVQKFAVTKFRARHHAWEHVSISHESPGIVNVVLGEVPVSCCLSGELVEGMADKVWCHSASRRLLSSLIDPIAQRRRWVVSDGVPLGCLGVCASEYDSQYLAMEAWASNRPLAMEGNLEITSPKSLPEVLLRADRALLEHVCEVPQIREKFVRVERPALHYASRELLEPLPSLLLLIDHIFNAHIRARSHDSE